MRNPRPRTYLAMLAAITAVGGSAVAQTSRPERAEPPAREVDPPATAPERKGEAPPGILAGPRVEESADRPGGAAAMTRSAPARDLVPPRMWMRILGRLDLDAEQRTKVRTIQTELDKTRRAFQAEHGEELTRLRREIAETTRGERAPDPEMRSRAQSLQSLAPKVEAYQERIWEQLTPEQRDAMKRNLDRAREQIRKRRAERTDAGTPGGRDTMMRETDEDPAERGLDERARRRLRFLRERRRGDG